MSDPTPTIGAVRSRYTFTFPPDIAEACGYQTVTLRELSPSEELRAAKRAETDPMALAYEIAKEAVSEADGVPVTTADASSDIFWAKLNPAGRQLVLTAHAAISSPTRDQVSSFLGSRVVKVA